MAEKQNNDKLNESKQFLTMKKMMKTKSQQVQQVRTQYEDVCTPFGAACVNMGVYICVYILDWPHFLKNPAGQISRPLGVSAADTMALPGFVELRGVLKSYYSDNPRFLS